MRAQIEGDQLQRLLRVGRELVAEHDMEAVLHRILEESRAITGARYAALGVLDATRTELERFLTSGIDPAAHAQIGELPRGRGVLGLLITDPRPLRLPDVGEHPKSYGFPVGHPSMHSFLGVPIAIRGQGWGNLYLTEKEGAEAFTEEDEEAATVLAQWAATAIDNARLHESGEERRQRLERAVEALEAARDIADAISSSGDLDHILELIAKRGRALIDARNVLILLRDGPELVIAASAGHTSQARGRRLPVAGSTSGQVLEEGRPLRVSNVSRRLLVGPTELGVPDARFGLFVPMIHRGEGIGVLAAFDHGSDAGEFSLEDEQLLRTFAASAGNAVAMHRSVESDRLRSAVAAADAERSRWARELHDQTLQSLGAMRIALSSALGREGESKDQLIRQTIEDVEFEIGNLRGIISDLRPSMLDDIGLLPAIEALLERRRAAGLEIVDEITLADAQGERLGLGSELETALYRILQESLTNIVKHAKATAVHVMITPAEGGVSLEVRDNGVGFEPAAPTSGFGLAGMRERVFLAGGSLRVESPGEGTVVTAWLPAGNADERVRSSVA